MSKYFMYDTRVRGLKGQPRDATRSLNSGGQLNTNGSDVSYSSVALISGSHPQVINLVSGPGTSGTKSTSGLRTSRLGFDFDIGGERGWKRNKGNFSHQGGRGGRLPRNSAP